MSSTQPPPADGKGAKPDAIRLAQRLMYVGAASPLISLMESPNLMTEIRDQFGSNNDARTGTDLDVIIYLGLASWLIGQALIVGAWLWMAWANGRGMSWARITATCLFAYSTFGTLIALFSSTPGPVEIGRLVLVLLGGVIVYLLWAGDGSREYYQTHSGATTPVG